MILVIASRLDRSAFGLVDRWRDLDARLVTCRDLSRAGWRYVPGEPGDSQAVIGEEVISFERISGVLTRIWAATEPELPHIALEDRGYVAAEMTAFLAGWLATAPVRVVNRPTPNCLMGPSWPQTRWVHEASRAGMRTGIAGQLLQRTNNSMTAAPPDSTTVTVIGDRCFGVTDSSLGDQAKRLAEAANVESLTVLFSRPDGDAEFLRACLAPDITQSGVSDALRDCFSTRAAAAA